MGKKGLQLVSITVAALFLLPAISMVATAASPPDSTPFAPARQAAPSAPAATLTPAVSLPSASATPTDETPTPEFASVAASSPQDALHQFIMKTLPRDNQNPDEVDRGAFAPTPLADTDMNNINNARWMNGSYQWLGESVDGRNAGGFQRADIDWWVFPMTNVSSGAADVFEFDVQKEAGEQLFIEVRVYPNFDYDNYQSPNTYYTVFWDNMNSTQGWGINSHVKVTAFEENLYFLYIRSPLRTGCCMVNYTLTNVTGWRDVANPLIDDNSNRTSADVFSPVAMPTNGEVEQNADMVDVYDMTSQFSIVPANGDSARVWLNVSVNDGRAGVTDFYNTTQMPAVTSNGDTLSVAALILFYPDVRGIWHSYTDAGLKGDILSVNGAINGTPLYVAVYTYSIININTSPATLSSIPGWIQYSFTSWARVEDRAPTFIPLVPNLAMWEDDVASGSNLVNLTPFFTDDWDSGLLRYRMNYNQQPTVISATITGDWLSVAPLQANYWGNITLQVVGVDLGFDRVPNTADDHATSSNYFTVNLRPVNDPPVLSDIGGKANAGAELEFKMSQGQTLALTPTVTDADGAGGFAFSLDTQPAFADFTASNGTLFFHPGNGDVGLHHLRETVSDGSATDNVSLLINVSNVNDNPRFVRVGGVNVTDFPHTFNARQGDLFTVTLQVDDPDWTIGIQDTINFAADRTFVTVTRDGTDFRLATATFTPTNAQVGPLSIVFSVTDGALGAFDDNITVNVLIANADDAPYFTSLATVKNIYNVTLLSALDLVSFDDGATQGHPFTMTVRAGDIDVALGLGDALTFSTSDASKFTVAPKPDGVTADVTVRPNQTDASRGYIDFDIIVTDQGLPALSATFRVHLGVANVNDVPVWTEVSSVNLTEDVEFAQVFSAMDPDGDPITYTADTIYFTVDPGTGLVQLTPTNELIEGQDKDFDVTFTARDNHNGIASMGVHFHISNVNSPPANVHITAPVAAASFGAGESIAARGSAEDLDAGDQAGLHYTWFIDEHEAGQGAQTLLVVENPEVSAKTVTIRLMVEDPHGLSTNQSVTITVNGTPVPPKSPGFEGAFALLAAAAAGATLVVLRRRRQ